MLLIRVSVVARKLRFLPFESLGFLLLAAFILASSHLSLTLFALGSDAEAVFSACLLLLLVFFGAFSPLNDHLLRLLYPLNVLYKSLFDLVVAHATIECLFEIILLLIELASLLEALLDPRAHIRQIILLKLLRAIKFVFLALLICNSLLELGDNFVGPCQRRLHAFAFLLKSADLSA